MHATSLMIGINAQLGEIPDEGQWREVFFFF